MKHDFKLMEINFKTDINKIEKDQLLKKTQQKVHYERMERILNNLTPNLESSSLAKKHVSIINNFNNIFLDSNFSNKSNKIIQTETSSKGLHRVIDSNNLENKEEVIKLLLLKNEKQEKQIKDLLNKVDEYEKYFKAINRLDNKVNPFSLLGTSMSNFNNLNNLTHFDDMDDFKSKLKIFDIY